MFKLLSLPVSKIQAIVLKMADLMVVINAFLIRRGPACYWWICQRASKPTGHCINQLIIWFCHFILSYICCMIIYCIQTLPESCIFILCCINQFIMFSFSCSLFSRTNLFFLCVSLDEVCANFEWFFTLYVWEEIFYQISWFTSYCV